MSLSAVVSKAVDTAFKSAGDLVDTKCVFHPTRTQPGTFDAETESRGADPKPHRYVRILVVENNQFTPDQSDVPSHIRNLLTPLADYPKSRPPRDGDVIEDSKGRMWRLRRLLSPPGSALIRIECREES